MEKFYAEDRYFESRNSELEKEYETQDLYHRLKTLEEREWSYHEYINELTKREASCRAELEESLVKLKCLKKMNDEDRLKFLEEGNQYTKVACQMLQQAESGMLELEEVNGKLAVVKRELGEANSYLRVTELKLQFANERVTRRESSVKYLNDRLCISEKRANDAIAIVELRNDELVGLTRTVRELQINNMIIEKEKVMLTQELASKNKESQVAMEVVLHEKEDIFKELEDTELQSQIKEKELQEELEVALCEKKDIFKELEDTELQSQIKEKELQEELEVGLCEKKIFFEHVRFKLQSQEKELAPSKMRREKKRTKRAVRVTCIKLSKTWRKKNKTKRGVSEDVVEEEQDQKRSNGYLYIKLIVALIFAFISVIYLWGKKY